MESKQLRLSCSMYNCDAAAYHAARGSSPYKIQGMLECHTDCTVASPTRATMRQGTMATSAADQVAFILNARTRLWKNSHIQRLSYEHSCKQEMVAPNHITAADVLWCVFILTTLQEDFMLPTVLFTIFTARLLFVVRIIQHLVTHIPLQLN